MLFGIVPYGSIFLITIDCDHLGIIMQVNILSFRQLAKYFQCGLIDQEELLNVLFLIFVQFVPKCLRIRVILNFKLILYDIIIIQCSSAFNAIVT